MKLLDSKIFNSKVTTASVILPSGEYTLSAGTYNLQ